MLPNGNEHPADEVEVAMLVLDVVDVVVGDLVVVDVVVDEDVEVDEDVVDEDVADEDVVDEDVVDVDVVEIGSLQSLLNKSAVSSVQDLGISGAP